MSDPENEKTEEEQLENALEETPSASPADDTAPAESVDDEVPAQPVEPEPDPAPEAEVATEAPARKPRTQAQKDKRKADTARRKAAIAAAPRAPDPSEEDLAEQDRKAKLRARMAEIQTEIDDLNGAVDEKKAELKKTSSELYPHLVESDHHVDAVRGYIASQKKERANRASNPARIKAILEAAGKSPVDAAFSAQRARGAKRPVRPAPGVTSDKTAATE
jgi:signal recognition particle GTPase